MRVTMGKKFIEQIMGGDKMGGYIIVGKSPGEQIHFFGICLDLERAEHFRIKKSQERPHWKYWIVETDLIE